MARFDGQVAIVTGAGRGIGRAIALRLAQEGARVVVNYCRSADAAEEVAAQIRGAGGMAVCCHADVSVAADVERLFAVTIEHFARLDILVNNAGITRDRLIARMSDEDWERVLSTNLTSAFLCCRAAGRLFLRQKSGIIVNVTSVVGQAGGAGQVNYSASKAGLIGLTKSLAKEIGSRGVRVNAVAPGFVETEMTAALGAEQLEAIRAQIPIRRFGSAADVAGVVAFLCSTDAAYIQGEIIAVDGGLFM